MKSMVQIMPLHTPSTNRRSPPHTSAETEAEGEPDWKRAGEAVTTSMYNHSLRKVWATKGRMGVEEDLRKAVRKS